jgi:cytochrome oxidase Cu insertion factor (SCO1/SenC/PrrC family)
MLKKAMTRLLPLALLAYGAALAQQTQPQTAQPAQTSQPAKSQQQPPAPPRTHLKVGQPAPDFTLTDTAGQKVKLSDFRGKKNVVLAFYVLAFTGG